MHIKHVDDSPVLSAMTRVTGGADRKTQGQHGVLVPRKLVEMIPGMQLMYEEENA